MVGIGNSVGQENDNINTEIFPTMNELTLKIIAFLIRIEETE